MDVMDMIDIWLNHSLFLRLKMYFIDNRIEEKSKLKLFKNNSIIIFGNK
jgi:hypothetical protein